MKSTHTYPSGNIIEMIRDGTIKINPNFNLNLSPNPIPNDIDISNKVDGMILGLAIGDGLGNTSESMNPHLREMEYGYIDNYLPNWHCEQQRVGLPSDDTQLAAWTIEQILETGSIDPKILGQKFCSEKIFGLGASVRQFLQKFKFGVPWTHSAPHSAGNGALMRIAPVIIPYLRQPKSQLWTDTLMAAHLTHNDDLSNSSCLTFVHMLWQLIGMKQAPSKHWWIEEWVNTCSQVSLGETYRNPSNHPKDFCGTMPELIRQYLIPALEKNLTVREACSIWYSGAFLLETVPTVLYILAQHGDDPEEAILQAVNYSRDNDTVAAIVGAAMGALYGADQLPQRWIDGLLGRTRSHDDGHLFTLLMQCAETFGWPVREQTRQRAERLSAYRP